MGRTRRSRFRFAEVKVLSNRAPGTNADTPAEGTQRNSIAIERSDGVGMHGGNIGRAPDADEFTDIDRLNSVTGSIAILRSQSAMDEYPCESVYGSRGTIANGDSVPGLHDDTAHREEADGDGECLIDLTVHEERVCPDVPDVGTMSTPLTIKSWKVLCGLLMTTGSTKLTRYQYQAMRMICEAFRREQGMTRASWKSGEFPPEGVLAHQRKIKSLPHFTTLASSYKRILYSHLSVRSADSEVYVDTTKAGARGNSYGEDGKPLVPVRFVLPSEYARADVASPDVFYEMCKTSLHSQPQNDDRADHECIDRFPVVFAREAFYGPAQCVSADVDINCSSSATGNTAEVGDVVNISLIDCQSCATGVQKSFGCTESPGDLKGHVRAIWTVQHWSRRSLDTFAATFDEEASERHRAVAHAFGYVQYRSPTDSVVVDIPSVPIDHDTELDHCAVYDDRSGHGVSGRNAKRKKRSPEVEEALKRRHEALRDLKKQTEEAWRQWVKPTIKPGDVVVLLSPCVAYVGPRAGEPHDLDEEDCLIVIYRFWVENEERSRHAMFLAASTPLQFDSRFREITDAHIRTMCSPIDSSDLAKTADVRHVRIVRQHSGMRGVAKFRPVSSMGTLANGEKYFIYRFLLFWDGFEITKGKSASGDGFYLICLNLPQEARSSACAVRVMSLSPPGVKSGQIFNLIQQDIVKGLTDGFIDVDATGSSRGIFLDFVGFLWGHTCPQ